MQARAEATRRKILDSAVELFTDLGYGETGLADVLQRAGVSKGAFYYHFDSKEAVATAIIEDLRDKMMTSAVHSFDSDSPLLERVILSTFDSAAILASDQTARVGHELLQALSQISPMASRVYREWTEAFVGVATAALQPWATRRGVDAAEVAEGFWVGVLGCRLLASALGEDHTARLARAWKPVLKLLAPPEEQQHYSDLVDEIAARYAVTV